MATHNIVVGVTGLDTPYKPHAKQLAFHRSNKRFKVASAGNRGGKTVVGAVEFIANIIRDLKSGKGKKAVKIGNAFVPRLKYWVIAPTMQIADAPYEEIVRYCPRDLIAKANAATKEIRLHGDVLIEFRSTERAERLIAASLNGVWMDEASKCKPEAWRGGLRARIADQEGWALFTTTPYGGRNNWVYQDLVSRSGTDSMLGSFTWTTAENDYFPRSEFEHARETQPEAWFKRDWLASWDSFGGAIYEEFRDELHVTSEHEFRLRHRLGARPLRDCFNRTVAAIDFGYHSGCMLTLGELGDNNWAVIDEVYGPGYRPITGSEKTWYKECRRVMETYGVSLFVGDYEDPGAIGDLSRNGIPIRSCIKNTEKGIRRVATAIHPRVDPTGHTAVGLHVFDRCKNLIRELRTYQWKPNREQTGFLEEPADNQDDHACDALRYAAMELRYYDYVESVRGGMGGDASVRIGQ